MAIKRDRAVLRQLGTLFSVGVIRDLTDGQLLERFSTGRGEAAELAFAALVDRHGPMVLRVCRARLSDPHDALDAFQATFLVLIEKARGLWVRDSLGPWLHAVAFRTASCAQAAIARRRQVERRAAELATDDRGREQRAGLGWEQTLHEEIDRLPERYRVPIVLCDLEGNTCEEAARRMGRPVGTVKSWRARGRERLRRRLSRSGLAPAIGLGAALAAGVARAAALDAEDAARALSARMTAGAVPASVGALVKGVLKTMFLKKLGAAAVVMVWALTFVAVGVGAVARIAADDSQAPRTAEGRQARPLPAPRPPFPDDTWPLSLREAIRICLENGEVFRLVPDSTDPEAAGTLAIAPAASGMEANGFKAEVMAAIRSVEQVYWSLAQQHVRLWAVEQAAGVGEEILNRVREALKAGRGTTADVAEAQQRLEQFNLDLVATTSDVITTERQLRNILGLRLADGRRIVPVTAPTEAKLEPDWNECLAAMLEKQPDIARAKGTAKSKGVDLDAITRSFLPDLAAEGPFAPARGNPALLGSAALQQTTREATHAMARFFREIDSDYKQYQTAKKLRAAAQERLAAQRAYYDEGRITIDRYLDVVSLYAAAVAQEAQSKADYNIAIVALEEAKGTLLEYDKITVVERPRVDEPVSGEATVEPSKVPAPAGREPSRETREAKSEPPGAAASGRTVSFQATISVGSIPFEIRGSFTVAPAAPLGGASKP